MKIKSVLKNYKREQKHWKPENQVNVDGRLSSFPTPWSLVCLCPSPKRPVVLATNQGRHRIWVLLAIFESPRSFAILIFIHLYIHSTNIYGTPLFE
jgi:hypothetical protein